MRGRGLNKPVPPENSLEFSLLKISELYGIEGKQLYFLGSDNKAVKVLDIKKVPHSGKIYDVTARNHIILVRRGTLTVWSGNSYNNSNGSKIYDYSDKGNNGTCYGSCAWNSTGKFGGAFMFDGNGDYVRAYLGRPLPETYRN